MKRDRHGLHSVTGSSSETPETVTEDLEINSFDDVVSVWEDVKTKFDTNSDDITYSIDEAVKTSKVEGTSYDSVLEGLLEENAPDFNDSFKKLKRSLVMITGWQIKYTHEVTDENIDGPRETIQPEETITTGYIVGHSLRSRNRPPRITARIAISPTPFRGDDDKFFIALDSMHDVVITPPDQEQ